MICDVVAAAVGDVPGVQAQVDVLRVGVLQELQDALLGVDMGVGVRVEHQLDAVLLEHTRPSSLVPVTRFVHCSGSRSPASVASPVCMSVYCSGRWTRYLAPTSRAARPPG